MKTKIKNTNILVINGQEFLMTVEELKNLRDQISQIVGEKIKMVQPPQPIIFPERPLDNDQIYPKIKPYKPWRTEDKKYPMLTKDEKYLVQCHKRK